jgi:hypothetical protein
MRRTTIPFLASILSLFTASVSAQSKGDAKTPVFDPAKSGVTVIFAPQKASAPAPAISAGQRAHSDGQGKLKDADPEESQALSDQITKSQVAAPAIQLSGAGGSKGVQLSEDFMMAATATIGPDGKLKLDCEPVAQSKPTLKKATPVSKSSRKAKSNVR